MRPLTITDTLEFYDVPQIFTATDATGVRYLCTLYDYQEGKFHYIGVQISEPRLIAFLGGQLDLRDAYLYPEVDNGIYHVEVNDGQVIATHILTAADVSEEMLPERGFFFTADDINVDELSQTDTYQLEVPAHDRITFSTLISRMGWKALSLGNSLRRLASL